jgi:AcrR family transcriptional regulator
MRAMSKLLLDSGRIVQKLKTREALLTEANRLLKEGKSIKVDEVARNAGISKATAYRYFSDAAALKREASLQLKSLTGDDLFKGVREDDLKGRLRKVIDYHYRLFTENETEFRLFLSSVIAESVSNPHNYTRGGRRIALIEEALRPLRGSIRKDVFNKLVASLSLIFGIESVTILKDLCGLDNAGVLAQWKWMTGRLVEPWIKKE